MEFELWNKNKEFTKQSTSRLRDFGFFERNNITRYHHKIVILSSSWNECSKLQPNKIYYTFNQFVSINNRYLLKVATIQECIKWV